MCVCVAWSDLHSFAAKPQSSLLQGVPSSPWLARLRHGLAITTSKILMWASRLVLDQARSQARGSVYQRKDQKYGAKFDSHTLECRAQGHNVASQATSSSFAAAALRTPMRAKLRRPSRRPQRRPGRESPIVLTNTCLSSESAGPKTATPRLASLKPWPLPLSPATAAHHVRPGAEIKVAKVVGAGAAVDHFLPDCISIWQEAGLTAIAGTCLNCS